MLKVDTRVIINKNYDGEISTLIGKHGIIVKILEPNEEDEGVGVETVDFPYKVIFTSSLTENIDFEYFSEVELTPVDLKPYDIEEVI